MSKIIAFCGKKESGKTTACNYLAGIHLTAAGIIQDFFGNPDGNIYDHNDKIIECNKLNQNLVRIYNFADTLKRFAIEVFGLNEQHVYSDKGQLTHLRWENMPGVVPNGMLFADLKRFWNKKFDLHNYLKCDISSLFYHDPGPMTVREVLQFFGTNVCRRMFHDCWVQNTITKIKQEQPMLALIADCRFDNEAKVVKNNQGFCILLRRNEDALDNHDSENGFLEFKQWDTIIDNRKTDHRQFYDKLIEGLSPTHINLKRV